MNYFALELKNGSFNHSININNIYLNESVILFNKCLFMHSIERVVQRNVSNGKIVFYKSINVITNSSL